MTHNCNCGYCSKDEFISDYDDIIAQLKETRDGIDKMIQALEHRKVKDNVINQILQTDYEEEDDEEEISQEAIDWITQMIEEKNHKTSTKYTIPFKPYITRYKYPFEWYPYYFKY